MDPGAGRVPGTWPARGCKHPRFDFFTLWLFLGAPPMSHLEPWDAVDHH